eukprot:COSAG04_NODE_3384_length_2869_cov_1.450181_5_plen_133_part_00
MVLPVSLTLGASPFQAQASQAGSTATAGEAQSGIEALEKERAQWEAKYTALASSQQATADDGGSEEVGMQESGESVEALAAERDELARFKEEVEATMTAAEEDDDEEVICAILSNNWGVQCTSLVESVTECA